MNFGKKIKLENGSNLKNSLILKNVQSQKVCKFGIFQN
jgi:hypothetical protein